MKTNQEIALEVIYGKWSVGQERRRLLEEAGYNYEAVQSIVNAIMSGQPIPEDKTPSGKFLSVELDLTKYKGMEITIVK